MTRISLHGDLSDLIDDLKTIKREAPVKASRLVGSTARDGAKLAREIARQRSGPHGKAYYKRIHAEQTGALTAEFGPDGVPKTEFVGAGFRHGVNTDLPSTADLLAPKFQRDAAKMLDDLFWPGAK